MILTMESPGGCLQVMLAGVIVGTLVLQIDVTLDDSTKFLGVSFTSGEHEL